MKSILLIAVLSLLATPALAEKNISADSYEKYIELKNCVTQELAPYEENVSKFSNEYANFEVRNALKLKTEGFLFFDVFGPLSHIPKDVAQNCMSQSFPLSELQERGKAMRLLIDVTTITNNAFFSKERSINRNVREVIRTKYYNQLSEELREKLDASADVGVKMREELRGTMREMIVNSYILYYVNSSTSIYGKMMDKYKNP